MTTAAERRERAREEATEWVIRLGYDDPADRIAFEAWRSASVENEIAFEWAMAAWQRLDRLRVLGKPGVERIEEAVQACKSRQPV